MHLPLRLAASVPLAIIVLGVLAAALLTADGRAFHPIYGYSNALLYAFLAGAGALLLVPPSLAAAMMVNRLAISAKSRFLVVLAGASVGACLVIVLALNNVLGSMGGFVDLDDWQPYAGMLANAALLVLTGAFFGSSR
jgi:hypothetical protein